MKTNFSNKTEKELQGLLNEKGLALRAFRFNVAGSNVVEILNASKADISDAKKEEYKYKSFSGFADGLSELTMKRVIEKKGYSEIFWQAVYGMLPRNKLRKDRMKRLIISV